MLRTQALTSRRLGVVSGDAEALYYRLMLVADDYGRFFGDIDLVQSYCYPRGERLVGPALDELININLIHQYERNGEKYLAFETWDQSVRAKVSKFPHPLADVEHVQTSVRRPHTSAPGVGDGDEVKPLRSMSAEFDEFWKAYPLKRGKRKAEGCYRSARNRASAEEILNGAKAYALEVRGREASKIKWAEGWLEGDRWTDNPTPTTPPAPETTYFEAQDPNPKDLEALAEAMRNSPWSKRKDLE
jgi:hypothetical protein